MNKISVIECLSIFCVSLLILPLLPAGLISFTIMDLHLSPLRFISDLQHMWNAEQYLGEFSARRLGYLFPVGTFYAFFNFIGIAPEVTERLWLIFSFASAGISMNFLLRTLLKRTKFWVRIIGSSFYMFNPYSLVLTHENPFLLLYWQFLPLILGLFASGLAGQNGSASKNSFLVAVFLSLTSMIDITSFAVVILTLVAYFLYTLIFLKYSLRYSLSFTLYVLVYFALFNSWFILPNIFQIGRGELIRDLQLETPLLYNQYSTYLEVLRMLGYWGFYSGYKGVPYFSFAKYYISNPIFISTTILIPAISAIGLLKNRVITTYFGLLLIFSVFMGAGANPTAQGTSWIYQLVYNNVPFFAIFRDGFKFQMVTVLSYSFLLASVMQYLNDHLNPRVTKGVTTRRFTTILIVFIIVANVIPVASTGVFESNRVVNVPRYWFEMASWFNSTDRESGVLLLPRQYFPVYTWGWTGSEVTEALLSNQLVFESPGTKGTLISDQVVNSIYDEFFSNDSRVPYFLAELGIKYVLLRGDIDYRYYNVESPDVIRSYLSRYGFRMVAKFGPLEVYENPVREVTRFFGASNVLLLPNKTSYSIASYLVRSLSETDVYVTKQACDGCISGVMLLPSTGSLTFYLPRGGYYRLMALPLFNVTSDIKDVKIELQIDGEYWINLYRDGNVWQSNSIYLQRGPHTLVFGFDFSKDFIQLEGRPNNYSIVPVSTAQWSNYTASLMIMSPNLDQGEIFIGIAYRNFWLDTYLIKFTSTVIWVYHMPNFHEVAEAKLTEPLKNDEWYYVHIEFTNHDIRVFLNGRPIVSAVTNGANYVNLTSGGLSIASYDSTVYAKDIEVNSSLPPFEFATIVRSDQSRTSQILQYQSYGTGLYRFKVSNNSTLVFNTAFDDLWMIYKGNVSIAEVPFATMVPNIKHFMVNDFANAWYVPIAGDYTIIFLPQAFFEYGKLISTISLLIIPIMVYRNELSHLAKKYLRRRMIIKI